MFQGTAEAGCPIQIFKQCDRKEKADIKPRRCTSYQVLAKVFEASVGQWLDNLNFGPAWK